MLSTESVQQAKANAQLERDAEARDLATKTMMRAQAVFRADQLVSNSFIGSVADDSGNERQNVSQALGGDEAIQISPT